MTTPVDVGGEGGGLAARDRRLFDRIAANYGRKDRVASSRVARRAQLLSALGRVLHGRDGLGDLLELGCGVAASSEYAAGLFRTYHGLDHSLGLLARALPRTHAGPGRALSVGSAGALPFPSDSFDTVLAVGVLHHLEDVPVALAEVRRVARPGGWLVAVEPQRGNPVISGLRRVRARIDQSYSEEQQFFDARELRRLAETAGLTDVSTRYTGFLTPPFAQVVLRPQAVFSRLSRLAVRLDHTLDRRLPQALRILSWNVVLYARA